MGPAKKTRWKRIEKWFVFGILAGLLPVLIDAIIKLYIAPDSLSLEYLFPPANTYLIGIGVVITGVAELLYDARRDSLNYSVNRLVLTLCGLVVLIGAIAYSLSKQNYSLSHTLAIGYLIVSIVISFIAVLVSGFGHD